MSASPTSFYVETLGCPKNAVDSDKVVASLIADGLVATSDASEADLVVVNTCAFIEAARQESIDVALSLADTKRAGAKLVVTGCMAERYGDELAAALPEADAVIGFAGEGAIADVVMLSPRRKPVGVRDLLELPRPAPSAPWAYVKVAEGCDRAVRVLRDPVVPRQAAVAHAGVDRNRSTRSRRGGRVRDRARRARPRVVRPRHRRARFARAVAPPARQLSAIGLARVRLLYLYPSEVHDPLVSTMLELPTVVPYFDLSLQHAAPGLLRGMKRWGSGDRFREIIEGIRTQQPDAVFRSSFIVGFPGETESDHDDCSDSSPTRASTGPVSSRSRAKTAPRPRRWTAMVAEDLVRERLRECAEMQDPITTASRLALVGEKVEVLIDGVDEDGSLVGRTFREAPGNRRHRPARPFRI